MCLYENVGYLDFDSHVNENNLKGTYCLIPADYQLQKSWLIAAHLACLVNRESRNTSWICTTAPNSIFSCSAVFTSVCQTDFVSVGHLQFYTIAVRSKCRAGTGRSQDSVLRAAALLGHVWTIQHGCHQSIPGVCSRWMMASHWSPDACNPENRPDLDCISNKCRWKTFIYTDMLSCSYKKPIKSRTCILKHNTNVRSYSLLFARHSLSLCLRL